MIENIKIAKRISDALDKLEIAYGRDIRELTIIRDDYREYLKKDELACLFRRVRGNEQAIIKCTNLLKRNGVTDIDKLMRLDAVEISKMRNCGTDSMGIIFHARELVLIDKLLEMSEEDGKETN